MQVEGALAALRAANEGPFEVLEALEAVARLSWSDDEARGTPGPACIGRVGVRACCEHRGAGLQVFWSTCALGYAAGDECTYRGAV